MAKTDKPVLGLIDCPHCGQVEGMAVKHDKNEEPFGHCEVCSGQLRVGGKPYRVRMFCKRNPWAAKSGAVPVTEPVVPASPVTVTVTETKEPEAAPVAPPKAKKKSSWMDALATLAVAEAVTG